MFLEVYFSLSVWCERLVLSLIETDLSLDLDVLNTIGEVLSILG